MTEIKIPIRIEDLSPLSTWLSSLVNKNLAEFKDFSPEFSYEYIAATDAKIRSVNELVSSKLFIGETVKATQNLYDNMLAARPALLKLEGYVVRAKDELSVAVKNFDFTGVRKCINGRDAEGFSKLLTAMLQMVEANYRVVETKGLKADTKNLLVDILSAHNNLAQEQNNKMLAKESAIAANSSILSDLWKDCKNIMDAGKRIYKYNDPEMVKNFTKVHIIKTMRHDTAHKKKKDVSV